MSIKAFLPEELRRKVERSLPSVRCVPCWGTGLASELENPGPAFDLRHYCDYFKRGWDGSSYLAAVPPDPCPYCLGSGWVTAGTQ